MNNQLLDTLMNVEVFVFVGVLIWLYFKPTDDSSGPKS